MWVYKLETNDGRIFYYDNNELEEAREDKRVFGGTLTDRNGKIY